MDGTNEIKLPPNTIELKFRPCYVIRDVPGYVDGLPANRKQKRRVIQELNRNIGRFFDVEDHFLGEMYFDNGVSYKETYDFYLSEWINRCKKMNEMKAFRYTQANPDFIQQMYYPMERERSDSVYKFNEWIRKKLKLFK